MRFFKEVFFGLTNGRVILASQSLVPVCPDNLRSSKSLLPA